MFIENTFKLFIDPSLYAFKWKDAEYVDVYYKAHKTLNGNVIVTTEVKAPMYLLGMIVVAGQWDEFNKHVQKAATANATGVFDGEVPPVDNNVHPTIMQAIAPHINY